MNCLKRDLNIKNKNINIKLLTKTNRPLIENPSTRKPGKKETTTTTTKILPALQPASIVNPKQVI